MNVIFHTMRAKQRPFAVLHAVFLFLVLVSRVWSPHVAIMNPNINRAGLRTGVSSSPCSGVRAPGEKQAARSYMLECD